MVRTTQQLELFWKQIVNHDIVLTPVFNLYVQFYPVGLGLHIVIALLALTEMVAAIVGSAFCCHGVCCTSHQAAPAIVSNINEIVQRSLSFWDIWKEDTVWPKIDS